MRVGLPRVTALRGLPRDGRLLFATRFVRLFAYGPSRRDRLAAFAILTHADRGGTRGLSINWN
ncbi:MAG TPA: hypothetical protein VKE74_01985 [Gemmataceae bacterium]|nr:hypothetical protein [Gemmataceae bacterium]